jgi:hypothetical protein
MPGPGPQGKGERWEGKQVQGGSSEGWEGKEGEGRNANLYKIPSFQSMQIDALRKFLKL